MAQTGDGKNGERHGLIEIPKVPAEFTSTPFTGGIVGMRPPTNDPNSAKKFFIM